MIIEIPFVYEAQVVPPRARNPRTVPVLDRLPLNIRELPPEGFPTVARHRDQFADVQGRGAVDIRSDGRRTFKEVEGVPLADLERLAGEGGETPFRMKQRLWFLSDPANAARHGAVAGRILSDGRRDRVADLVRAASSLVVSGGKLFEACGEPAWRRRHGWTFEAVLATPELLRDHPGALLRADRLAEFLARHPVGKRPELWGGIEVLRPDLLRLSVETPALLKEAARMAESLGDGIARNIDRATREEFDLYATLRDALAAAPEGEVTDDLAAAIRIVIDALPGDDILGGRLRAAHEAWRRELIRDFGPSADPGAGTAVPGR